MTATASDETMGIRPNQEIIPIELLPNQTELLEDE